MSATQTRIHQTLDRSQNRRPAFLRYWHCENGFGKRCAGSRATNRLKNRDGSIRRQTAGPRMENDRGDDSLLLPGPAQRRLRPLRGMPAIVRLRRDAIGTLPVWHGKTHVRQLSSPLLPACAAGTGQGGDALRRPAHALAAPDFKPIPLAGRFPQSASSVSHSNTGAYRQERLPLHAVNE